MSPARVVTVRGRAAADIAAAAVGIALRASATSAARWRRRIEAVIRDLAQDADRWHEADEAADLGIDLRCRLFGRGRKAYRILFTITGNTVIVHRVVSAAQDRLQPGDV